MRDWPNWRQAQEGVMVYMPAPSVSLRDTEQSLSRLSVDDDESSGKNIQSFDVHYSTVTDYNVGVQANGTVISSCEDDTSPQIKTETESPMRHRDLPPEDSPLEDNTGEIFSDAVHVTYPSPSSSANVSSSDLLSQLVAAATCASPVLGIHESDSSQLSTASSLTEDFILVDNDSDNTDFQEESPSPLVMRNARRKRQSATSNHFRRLQHDSTKPLVRRLFASELKKQLTKGTTRSEGAQALDLLRSVERTPRRLWDEDERELLCIINRWYCAKDHATELTVFSKIFNIVTGLDLDSRKIDNQFTHLRYYGGDAYPPFRRVFAVPFDDPMGQYAAIRALLESTAETHDLDLQRRQSEPEIQSGMARYAESPKTQKNYLNLVQKASQDDYRVRTSHQISAVPQSMSMSMAVQLPEDDNREFITDAETSPTPCGPAPDHNPQPAKVKPHLAFRVWDTASRTCFIDGGFVAHAFLDWPLPLPSPIALDDPTQAGKILASLHLSTQGGTPVFISTASVSILRSFCLSTTNSCSIVAPSSYRLRNGHGSTTSCLNRS